MNWFIRLLRQLISIFSPRSDRAKREKTILEQDTGQKTVHIALFQTKQLSKARGRTPEVMVARYYAQALAEAGLDYKIAYGYEKTYEPPTETPGSSVEAFNWWAENQPEEAHDSNMLLMDAGGGGRAYVGGNAGIVGINRVKRLGDARTPCDSSQCGNIWAAIHELGHNLGGRHDTPMMNPKPAMTFSPEMEKQIHEEYFHQ